MLKFSTYSEGIKAIEAATNLEEVKSIFGYLFYGTNDFFTPKGQALQDYVADISKLIKAKHEFSEYELAEICSALSLGSNLSSNTYDYLLSKNPEIKKLLENKKLQDIENLKNNLSKNDSLINQQGEKFISKKLPELTDILSGKDQLMSDITDLWQVRADIWDMHRVIGLKNYKGRYEGKFLADKELLADAIIKKMDNNPNLPISMTPRWRQQIKDMTTGKLILYKPTKADRLFYELYLETRDACFSEIKDFSDDFQALRKDLFAREENLKIKAKKLYDDVIGTMINNSPVSENEAKEWANNNVYIDKKVASALRSIDYPEDKLREDIAEYYRLCGGKLGPVEFTGSGKAKRAYASGKYQINLDEDFNKRKLFHECSHLVERYDSFALSASIDFIKNRATGKTQPLKKLAHNGYRKGEIAYPDNFIDPYVGKFYEHSASEVFSMGMQMLSDPETLLYFIQKDPEHFKLTIGQCLHQNKILKISLDEENKKAAQIMEEAASKTDLKNVWEKALKKAMPGIFKEALFKGFENIKLEAGYNKTQAVLYIYDKEYYSRFANVIDRYFGKINFLFIIAYLYLISKNCLLYYTGYGIGENTKIRTIIKDIIYGELPPALFDPDLELPKYNLPSSIIEVFNNEERKKKLYDLFYDKILELCQPIITKLESVDGYEGYTIKPNHKIGSGNLYSQDLRQQKSGDDGYIGNFPLVECRLIATYLILNKRKLIPETYDKESTAIVAAKRYLLQQILPPWFTEETKLPESL